MQCCDSTLFNRSLAPCYLKISITYWNYQRGEENYISDYTILPVQSEKKKKKKNHACSSKDKYFYCLLTANTQHKCGTLNYETRIESDFSPHCIVPSPLGKLWQRPLN